MELNLRRVGAGLEKSQSELQILFSRILQGSPGVLGTLLRSAIPPLAARKQTAREVRVGPRAGIKVVFVSTTVGLFVASKAVRTRSASKRQAAGGRS